MKPIACWKNWLDLSIMDKNIDICPRTNEKPSQAKRGLFHFFLISYLAQRKTQHNQTTNKNIVMHCKADEFSQEITHNFEGHWLLKSFKKRQEFWKWLCLNIQSVHFCKVLPLFLYTIGAFERWCRTVLHKGPLRSLTFSVVSLG